MAGFQDCRICSRLFVGSSHDDACPRGIERAARNIIDLLDPDVIVMGGGVAAMLSPFFGEIKDRLSSWCVNSRSAEIPLVIAHYGADAGIAGGAALCS